MNDDALIEIENRLLVSGEIDVFVDILEDHTKHIKAHRLVLSNPNHSCNSEVVNRTLSHIQEHLDALLSDPLKELKELL